MDASTKKPLLTLERYLPYRLSILSNKVSGIVAQTYKDKFALSVTEWRIMAVLGEYSGISADEVSLKTQIEKSLIKPSSCKTSKSGNLYEEHFQSRIREGQNCICLIQDLTCIRR